MGLEQWKLNSKKSPKKKLEPHFVVKRKYVTSHANTFLKNEQGMKTQGKWTDEKRIAKPFETERLNRWRKFLNRWTAEKQWKIIRDKYNAILYCWKFLPNRAHSHWLLQRQMTSNNAPSFWAGNIKRVTVHCSSKVNLSLSLQLGFHKFSAQNFQLYNKSI